VTGPVAGVSVGDLTVALVEARTASAGETVAEDDAVEVIGFVLKAAGQLPSAGQLDVVAVLVLPATDCDIGPREFGEAARQGQAALVPALQVAVATLGQLDDGVAHHPDVPPQLGVHAVVDERSEANPIWEAANPAPWAAALVANMSPSRYWRSSPKSVTGRAGWCRTSAPHRTISRTVPRRVNWSIGMTSSWRRRGRVPLAEPLAVTP